MAEKSPKKSFPSSRPRGFERVLTENKEIQKLQENIATAVEGLDKNLLLKNKLLEGIELSPEEPDVINHGLGQCPKGWQIVDRSGSARVWRIAWDAKTISLQADEAVTVSIMVF